MKPIANYHMLARVTRWNTLWTIRPQSVAEHTFGVLWIYVFICHRLQLEPRADVMLKILEHDIEEAFTGDIPAPAMPEPNPEMLGTDDLMVLLADKLEAWLFLRTEARMGNWSVKGVSNHLKGQVDDILAMLRRHVEGPIDDIPDFLYMQSLRRTEAVEGS